MSPTPFRSSRRTDRGSVAGGYQAERLSRVPPVPHDPDERPTREDLRPPPGSQLFKIPVPVPRFLVSRKERRKT